MSGKKFFDTNILAYAVDLKDSRKADIARECIRLAVVEEDGVVSYQILQEFLNVGFRKFAPPLTPELASFYLASWSAHFQVIPWSFDLMSDALRIRDRYGFQWYDSLWIAAALEAGCECLYTEDLQHGQVIERMTITNPFV